MTEPDDDLVTALVEVLLSGPTITSETADWLTPHQRAYDRARAVLASGLVLPAADVIPKQAVLDLADRWWAEEDAELAEPWLAATVAELRALVAGDDGA